MKPLTVEELSEAYLEGELSVRGVVHGARLHMIPEDEAGIIPKLEDWPEWAKSYKVYGRFEDGNRYSVELDKEIASIPRPIPEWVPKDFEPVICAKPE